MDEDEFVDSAVQHALATSQMAATTSYLSRGRAHQETSIDDLKASWVALFRSWSTSGEGRTEFDDVDAELSLRNIEPPYELVKPEIDALVERAKSVATNPDATDRIGGSIIDDFMEAKRREN